MKLLGEVTEFDGKSVTIRLVPDGLPESHRAHLEREAAAIRVGAKVWVSDASGEPESSGIGFSDD